MKYTIHGLQQQGLIDLGLNHTDALLLRFFLDFKAESRMKEIIVDGETFYWLSFKNIEEQIPIIKNDSVSISRKFRLYEDLGLIKKIVKNTPQGKKAYLNTTVFFTEKLSEYKIKSHGDKKDHGVNSAMGIKSHGDKKDYAHGDKKDHAIYNSSISDSSHHLFKKINKKENFFSEDNNPTPIRKKRKQKQPSEKQKLIAENKTAFINKISNLYPKHRTDEVGFKRLNVLYDEKILNRDSPEITKQNEIAFIQNLEACLGLFENHDYMYTLTNYAGTGSERSKNYHKENFIEKLKYKKQNNQPSSRVNPQHHYCKSGRTAERMKADRAAAKKLWEEKGIETEGFVFLD